MTEDLYTVLSDSECGGTYVRSVRMDLDSVIYKVHFPGNPITPGACQIEMFRKMASDIVGCGLKVVSIKNLKFLQVVDPRTAQSLIISEQITSLPDASFKCSVTLNDGDVVCTKASLILRRDVKTCVIVPTYNNSGTVGKVIEDVLRYVSDLIVVSDGADDATVSIIKSFGSKITVIEYAQNKGKGYALKKGFELALKMGFEYAITMDSDGQHFADDLPVIIRMIECGNGELFIGSRDIAADNMPSGNTFANKFSNFWFAVQTFRRLPDTQTGFRAYPLKRCVFPVTNRYESELETLVRSVWMGVDVVPVKVKVYYAPAGERVSHFRKWRDFTRISLLNTVMTMAALFYGWPSMLIRKITRN